MATYSPRSAVLDVTCAMACFSPMMPVLICGETSHDDILPSDERSVPVEDLLPGKLLTIPSAMKMQPYRYFRVRGRVPTSEPEPPPSTVTVPKG